ncbi:MAG: hypothetical protein U9Q80_00515 [Bacillota bacterium]|nr:hypothetical protein [Bacillota bacterium]
MPIFCKNGKQFLRKNDISVASILGSTDVYLHGFSADVVIFETKYFGFSKTRRIHERKHGFVLEIVTSIYKSKSFMLG